MIHVDEPFYCGEGYHDGDTDTFAIVETVLNRYRNGGRSGVFAAQRDLNKLGLKEYAQL